MHAFKMDTTVGLMAHHLLGLASSQRGGEEEQRDAAQKMVQKMINRKPADVPEVAILDWHDTAAKHAEGKEGFPHVHFGAVPEDKTKGAGWTPVSLSKVKLDETVLPWVKGGAAYFKLKTLVTGDKAGTAGERVVEFYNALKMWEQDDYRHGRNTPLIVPAYIDGWGRA